MISRLFTWFTDPTAVGRKRTIFACAVLLSGALHGVDAGLHDACLVGVFEGGVCAINPGSAGDYIDAIVEFGKTVTEDPRTDVFGFLFGAWAVIDGLRKKAPTNPPTRGSSAGAMIIAALTLLAPVASAQDATAPEYSLTSGSTTLVTSGPRKEYFTARLGLRVFTDSRITAEDAQRNSVRIRATLTATQDGGAVALGSPETFQSIVPEIEYRHTLRGTLQAAAIGNVTFSAEGSGTDAPLDARMFSAFAGIRGALSNGTWLFAGAGKAGPVGPEVALTVRGGRPLGNGDVAFEYVLPFRADALRNKAWTLQISTTYQVARGELN